MKRWIVRATDNLANLEGFLAGTTMRFVVEKEIEGMEPGMDKAKVIYSAVIKPSHYGNSTAIADLCEEMKVGFMLGNAIKYCFRAGKKDSEKTIQDLEKARNYIQMKIDSLQNKSTSKTE